jgi:hypothetical protein
VARTPNPAASDWYDPQTVVQEIPSIDSPYGSFGQPSSNDHYVKQPFHIGHSQYQN